MPDPDFYNTDPSTQAIVSVIQARGVHDPAVRRMMLKHIRLGRVDAMRHATSQFLIADALARSKVPAPTLPRLMTGDLRERVTEAVTLVVAQYFAAGGIILARGYWEAGDMVEYLCRLWTLLAPKPIAKTEGLPSYEQVHERIARASVAAQAVRELLEDPDYRYTDDPHNVGSLIRPKDLESFCVQVVKIVEKTFNAPDEWVHQQLHRDDAAEAETYVNGVPLQPDSGDDMASLMLGPPGCGKEMYQLSERPRQLIRHLDGDPHWASTKKEEE